MDALLRDGLLAGLPVVVAGAGALADAVAAATAGLGGAVTRLDVDPLGDQPPADHPDGVVLVWDGAGAFAAAGAPSVDAARAALDGAWLAVRPVGAARDGKIVLLAPPPGTAHAEAARAGLENLARTLGIEWARLGIRTVAILPGARTGAGEIAQLVAYLASPAGDYFSGCAIALGSVDAAQRS